MYFNCALKCSRLLHVFEKNAQCNYMSDYALNCSQVFCLGIFVNNIFANSNRIRVMLYTCMWLPAPVGLLCFVALYNVHVHGCIKNLCTCTCLYTHFVFAVLQDVAMREIKKMLGSHNKDYTTSQKRLNTLVNSRCYMYCTATNSYHTAFL